MSSIVSSKAAAALVNGRTFRSGNTLVVGGSMTLHGNEIARDVGDGYLAVTAAGWLTVTTKARLNALPNVTVTQRRGVWFLNDQPWDGDWAMVNKS
jgi:hypothetical protein